MAFESNVFINCPFDDDYVPNLRAIVFTLIYLNLEPQLSQTISSSNIRINQIKNLIRSCKFGIHDLSRSKGAQVVGELPRLNMPYELGLDIGALEFGNTNLKQKKILILDSEKYHFQKVLSDIAGQDISAHKNEPKTLIRKVRDWISVNNEHAVVEPSGTIWIAFNQFTDDLLTTLGTTYSP